MHPSCILPQISGVYKPALQPLISFVFSLRYLVEQRDVDLNVRDNWDSTPL